LDELSQGVFGQITPDGMDSGAFYNQRNGTRQCNSKVDHWMSRLSGGQDLVKGGCGHKGVVIIADLVHSFVKCYLGCARDLRESQKVTFAGGVFRKASFD